MIHFVLNNLYKISYSRARYPWRLIPSRNHYSFDDKCKIGNTKYNIKREQNGNEKSNKIN